MPAASHLHAAFIVSTDPGLRGGDDEEDRSLIYSYPAEASSGTAIHVNSFKSLSLAIRGVLDSICGEKTKLVSLEQGGSRLLLASAHLESAMLLVALRGVVPPGLATTLVVHLAETLVLLLGPVSAWFADPAPSGSQLHPETLAILDRVFEGVLTSIDSSAWVVRMAPWHSFESSCLQLALPVRLQQRLTTIIADHAAQHHKAPFSFFQKHSCLMYRGMLLTSDLNPLHAKQLWQLLWTLGVFQHSSGLPCQILTRIIHLPQTAPGVSGAGGARGAPGCGADAGVMVSERPMGHSLLVVAAALHLVLAVVLTAYDEEIEEELAGRLEGHSAAELLQRIHGAVGADLSRLVEASVAYGTAARSLDAPVPPPGDASQAGRQAPNVASGKGGAAGSSLLFKLMHRNRSAPRRDVGGASGGFLSRPASGSNSRSLPTSPGKHHAVPRGPNPAIPPSPGLPPQPTSLRRGAPAAADAPSPPAGQPHERSARGRASAAAPPPAPQLPAPAACSPGMQPVPAPEGCLLLIAHDPPRGAVRLLGDLPPGPALPAVWRGVAACRARFAAHAVAVAAPPKHARLSLTLAQVEALSAARSCREGGQRLGSADSSPWQYHPELAALAAAHTITLRLQAGLARGDTAGNTGGAGGSSASPGGGGSGSRAPSSWAAAAPAAASASPPGALYLTACLLPDGREVYCVHGAGADEARLLEGLWEGMQGQEGWAG